MTELKTTFLNLKKSLITVFLQPVVGRNAVRLPVSKNIIRDYTRANVFDDVKIVRNTRKFTRETGKQNETNTSEWDVKNSFKKTELTNMRIKELTIADIAELDNKKLDVVKGKIIKPYWAESTLDEAEVALSDQKGFSRRTIAKYYAVYTFLEKEQQDTD